MKKIFFALMILAVFASVALPITPFGTSADSGVVIVAHAQQNEDTGIFGNVCDGPDCQFPHLIQLVRNILQFLILVSIPLATIVIAYGGFLMLTANGNSSKIDDAKELIFNVLKGFAIVLTAWLIVYTIVDVLLDDDSYENFLETRTPQTFARNDLIQ